jgi:hypothetical protein
VNTAHPYSRTAYLERCLIWRQIQSGQWKEIKRLALHELLDYVSNNRQVITEATYPRVVVMFSTNLLRSLNLSMNPQCGFAAHVRFVETSAGSSY